MPTTIELWNRTMATSGQHTPTLPPNVRDVQSRLTCHFLFLFFSSGNDLLRSIVRPNLRIRPHSAVAIQTLRAIVEGRVHGRPSAMEAKESSEDEEETRHDVPFGKFDETIMVRNAEEIKSPVSRRPSASRRSRKAMLTSDSSNTLESSSPRGKHDFRR